ncbi:hypothetical protein N658DRAFT_113824 [Parathielavia hyrcaniae]|uniref:Uncharacterized protein n=1 Tax=Parathielavia hyrcaniae TaxID=113614 RepID=A0AAN6Q814_9PEZI|nr:hypothetical protein N658DRAFT_113824 [Parathielavia hyrcaniae]
MTSQRPFSLLEHSALFYRFNSVGLLICTNLTLPAPHRHELIMILREIRCKRDEKHGTRGGLHGGNPKAWDECDAATCCFRPTGREPWRASRMKFAHKRHHNASPAAPRSTCNQRLHPANQPLVCRNQIPPALKAPEDPGWAITCPVRKCYPNKEKGAKKYIESVMTVLSEAKNGPLRIRPTASNKLPAAPGRTVSHHST